MTLALPSFVNIGIWKNFWILVTNKSRRVSLLDFIKNRHSILLNFNDYMYASI